MGQPLITIGDKTSHGGVVMGATMLSLTGDKPIARVGDMTACPKCKGMFPIAEGDGSLIIDGAAAAYHGCKTACGASLIAGQQFTTTAPSSGAAPGAPDSGGSSAAASRYGAVGAGLAAAYEELDLDAGKRYQGRFQLVNESDGKPIAGSHPHASAGGQEITGTTDADGFTQWVDRDAAEALAFDLIEKENA